MALDFAAVDLAPIQLEACGEAVVATDVPHAPGVTKPVHRAVDWEASGRPQRLQLAPDANPSAKRSFVGDQ